MKSEREKQISHINACNMESKKMMLKNLYAGLQGRHRDREQTYWLGLGREKRGWDERREQHWNIGTTTCKTDGQWGFAAWLGELKPGLYKTEGWEGMGGRREVQEGGDIHISMAGWFMLMYGRKLKQCLKAIILQLRINFLKR